MNNSNADAAPQPQAIQLKAKAMCRIFQASPDGKMWTIKIHVIAEAPGGGESVVGEAELRSLDFGIETFRIIEAQIHQAVPALIAMKTARISPATFMPNLPPVRGS